MFKTTDAATPEEYIDRLEDVDVEVLSELIRAGAAFSPTKG